MNIQDEFLWAVNNNDLTKFVEYLEQKKKEWQNEAIRNYLEKESEDALCLD